SRELARSAALQKQHLVRIRHAEQALHALLSRGVYLLELAAPVAHLHHRHAAAVPVEQLGLRPHKDRLRHLRRARREIISPFRQSGHFLLIMTLLNSIVFSNSSRQIAAPTSISPKTASICTFLTTPRSPVP